MPRRMASQIVLTLMLASVLILSFNMKTSTVGSLGLSDLERQVLSLINGTRAYNTDLGLEEIALQHHAFRSGGSAGGVDAAYWIKEKFQSLGLAAWLEPFEFTTWDLLTKPSLIVDDDGNLSTTYDQVSMQSFQSIHLSWPTPGDGVLADLVVLPLPEAANRSEIGLRPINQTAWAVNTTGKIVLIGKEVRWSGNWWVTFLNKLTSQPPAALIYTWWYDWMSFTPVLLSSAEGKTYWDMYLPVGCVDYGEGLWVRNRENTVNVSAHFSIKSVIDTGTHYNVVGKIAGYENPEKCVIISGHYDTVTCCGFCDNGAGTAGVIELAKVFADAVRLGLYEPKYTLLFVAFTSEEFYLVGSVYYVKTHKSEMHNVIAVINLDCVGSDELYVTETNPANGFDLDQIIVNAAQDIGITATLESPGGSDQETFRSPSIVNDDLIWFWGVDPGISDATPVESSAMLDSYPLFYSDLWSMGTPGYIHTSYDNSTSTQTLNWVEVGDLENQIKVAALTTLRISPTITGILLIKGPYYTWYGTEYWIVEWNGKHPIRLVSNYY